MLYLLKVIKDVFYKMVGVIKEFPRFLEVFELKCAKKLFPYATEVLIDQKCEKFNSCIEVGMLNNLVSILL